MKAKLNAIQNEIRNAATRKKELDQELSIEQHRLGSLLSMMKEQVNEYEWNRFVTNDCKMELSDANRIIRINNPKAHTKRLAG